MKRFSRLFVLGLTVALLIVLVAPVTAQDGVGPGEGGTIIESNFGDDAASFNPIVGNDTSSYDVYRWMYPDIIGADDITLQDTPNVDQALATGWEYDETGTYLTVHLREDAFWSDGVQITADDYIWAYEAVRSGETSSPRTYVMYQIADGTVTEGAVHEMTKIDDFTIQFHIGNVQTDDDGNMIVDDSGSPILTPNCVALNDLNDIPVVPAHVFEATFGDNYAAMDNDPYFVPKTENGPATFGPFTDPYYEPGVLVSMVADQNYPDAIGGQVTPGEWIYQNVEDTTVQFERFLAGDYSYLEVSADHQNGLRGDERFQTIEYPQNGFTFLDYNLADPNNPQPGRDENGDLIDQGLHPIFGDVRVRQALAHAIDVREMIGTRPEGDQPATGILEGNGYQIATENHPGLSGTSDELEAMGVVPYTFDPELAGQMLEEAGWVDSDGDGVRECHDCLYATEVDPSYEGSPMEFELLTNAGNAVREAAAETIRAQLGEIGITVNFQAIEFGTLVDEFLNQTFDAIVLGWNMGLPYTPDTRVRFGIGNDRPGAGYNTSSYQNEAMDALQLKGDTLPGCDPDERDAIYAEAQRMLWEDQPNLWLYAYNTMFAAQANIEGWDPLPYNALWNIETWNVTEK